LVLLQISVRKKGIPKKDFHFETGSAPSPSPNQSSQKGKKRILSLSIPNKALRRSWGCSCIPSESYC